MHRFPGFTLIELLVVVTIIAVLLALLVPAMDKAVYQAQLASCGARLDGLGAGVTTYAFDFKNRYPHRPTVAEKRAAQMRHITDVLINSDERPILNGYVPLKLLQCPMCEQIDLESPPPSAVTTVTLQASYDLWYGWRFDGAEKGMMRLGDRWEWAGRSYSLMAGDLNLFHVSNPVIVSSHPDADDKLASVNKISYSDWRLDQGQLRRGFIDQNYLYADGSVIRFASVGILDDGGRRSAVPWGSFQGGVQPAGWQLWVPSQ